MQSNTMINIINDFPVDKFNLLVPVQSIQEINPIYKFVTNTVTISTNLDDKDIYQEVNAKSSKNDAMYALTHKALMKLMKAANGQILDTVKIKPRVCEKCIDVAKATRIPPKCNTCSSAYNVAVQVTMKFPELSGGWQIFKASREIDLNASSLKEGQKVRVKEFAVEHAESKAMSRCIRKALNIKNAYTLAELEKPFVVAYPVLDANDPDVKHALIAGQMAASNLLYGSGLQLNAGSSQEMLSEGRIETDSENQVEADDYTVEPLEDSREEEPEKFFCGNPECGIEIQANVAEYSTKRYRMPLCVKCQQIVEKKKKEKEAAKA